MTLLSQGERNCSITGGKNIPPLFKYCTRMYIFEKGAIQTLCPPTLMDYHHLIFATIYNKTTQQLNDEI